MSVSRCVVVGIALAVAGCREAPTSFRVESIAPDPATRTLRLNEPIVIHFSRPIDPSSVRETSFRVESADGKPARGEFRVAVDSVSFLPRIPTEPTFEDAGLLPGTRIRIALAGFPDRLGILSTTGDPLESTFEASFAVVDPGADTAGFDAFVDPRPETSPRLVNGATLRLEDTSVAPHGVLWLEFSEPLAPRSVTTEAFDLRFENLDREPVPFSLTLKQTPGASAVSLGADGGFRVGTAYLLLAKSPMRLRDLVGNPVEDIAPIVFRCATDGRLELGRGEEAVR